MQPRKQLLQMRQALGASGLGSINGGFSSRPKPSERQPLHPSAAPRNLLDSSENKENTAALPFQGVPRYSAGASHDTDDFFFADHALPSASYGSDFSRNGARNTGPTPSFQTARLAPAPAPSHQTPAPAPLQSPTPQPSASDPPRSYCDATNDCSVGFDGTRLVPVSALLPHHAPVFHKYKFFNVVQSKCFETVYHADDNVVVAAPTGCGKTAIFELAVLRLFRSWVGDPRDCPVGRGKTKAIYICPLKALCEERYADWSEKFSPLGLRVAQVTGDTQHADFSSLNSIDIIITTPEKWDTLTRRWNASASSASMMNSLGLLMVDEIHVLNENRGACVEGTVTRCKMVKSTYAPALADARNTALMGGAPLLPPIATMRILALSATVPNLGDIAEWLEAKSFGFGPQYRPVPLEVIVRDYPPAKSSFMFSHILNFRLADLIRDHSGGRPTLVFCATRKECMSAAQEVVKQALQRAGGRNPFVTSSRQRGALDIAARTMRNKQLADVVVQGVGVHTAGLEYSDRQTIERLFLDNLLPVLCTTSTLAQGVNLPAHLVIVKGTQAYNTGTGYEEYAGSAVVQMMGRAGRPQFDISAKCIIMTQQSTRRRYENITQTPIESTLTSAVVEHLNAEIVLGTVRTAEDAHRWIRNTYLYVRAKRLAGGADATAGVRSSAALAQASSAGKAMHTTVNTELQRLIASGLVQRHGGPAEAGSAKEMSTALASSDRLEPTMLGQLMARYYLRFETASSFAALPPDADIETIVDLCAEANEFQGMQIKMGEKTALGKLNRVSKKDQTPGGFPGVRFPVKRSGGGSGSVITDGKAKIKVLLQCALDPSSRVADHELTMAMETIIQGASRLLSALAEYLASRETAFEALRNTLTLRKALGKRMWGDIAVFEDRPPEEAKGKVSMAHIKAHILQQLDGIGPKYCQMLHQRGISSFGDLTDTTPAEIDVICGRGRAFSTKLLESLQAVPRIVIDIAMEPGAGNVAVTGSYDRRARVTMRQLKDDFRPQAKLRQGVTLLVGDDSNRVLFNKQCWLSSQGAQEWSYIVTVPAGATITATAIDKVFVGVDVDAVLTVPGTRQAAPPPSAAHTGEAKGSTARESDPAPAAAGSAKPTRQEVAHSRAKELLEAKKQAESRKLKPQASPAAIAAAASALASVVGTEDVEVSAMILSPHARKQAAPVALDEGDDDLDGLGDPISDIEPELEEDLAMPKAGQESPIADPPADEVDEFLRLMEPSAPQTQAPTSSHNQQQQQQPRKLPPARTPSATDPVPAPEEGDRSSVSADNVPTPMGGGSALYRKRPAPSDAPVRAPSAAPRLAGTGGSHYHQARGGGSGRKSDVFAPIEFGPAAPGATGPLADYFIRNGKAVPQQQQQQAQQPQEGEQDLIIASSQSAPSAAQPSAGNNSSSGSSQWTTPQFREYPLPPRPPVGHAPGPTPTPAPAPGGGLAMLRKLQARSAEAPRSESSQLPPWQPQSLWGAATAAAGEPGAQTVPPVPAGGGRGALTGAEAAAAAWHRQQVAGQAPPQSAFAQQPHSFQQQPPPPQPQQQQAPQASYHVDHASETAPPPLPTQSVYLGSSTAVAAAARTAPSWARGPASAPGSAAATPNPSGAGARFDEFVQHSLRATPDVAAGQQGRFADAGGHDQAGHGYGHRVTPTAGQFGGVYDGGAYSQHQQPSQQGYGPYSGQHSQRSGYSYAGYGQSSLPPPTPGAGSGYGTFHAATPGPAYSYGGFSGAGHGGSSGPRFGVGQSGYGSRPGMYGSVQQPLQPQQGYGAPPRPTGSGPDTGYGTYMGYAQQRPPGP